MSKYNPLYSPNYELRKSTPKVNWTCVYINKPNVYDINKLSFVANSKTNIPYIGTPILQSKRVCVYNRNNCAFIQNYNLSGQYWNELTSNEQ